METIKIILYFLPLMFLWWIFVRRRVRLQEHSISIRDAALQDGLSEPASLHPVVDHKLCIGCRSCIQVCPEQPLHQVLGLINGKAHLIGPADCIGHGACKTVCPVDAITLVFGTERRGVDIPVVQPNFETNVPGVFIAGELGGMGLIRNAIEQGRQALEHIRQLKDIGKQPDQLDVVIIGAGPAGFSASLAAMEHNLQYVTLEQDSLGGTVAHYPRGKLVMTAPAHLPLVGNVKFTETTKEELLEFWEDVEKRTGVRINYHERLDDVEQNGHGFIVKTNRNRYKTRAILLAIGRRGTPRKLGVPGEELEKVVYRLIDPEQYRNQHVLVVGGGDSALEAAASIADEPGAKVILSYRSEASARAKAKNRARVEEAETAGKMRVLAKSNVKEIHPDHVLIEKEGKLLKAKNDAVIVCAGGILPTPFLKKIGIDVETKYGTP